MCGIVGKVNVDSNHPVDEARIRQMSQIICHRGPDDEGVWVKGSTGLGHRRLAIIDLTPTGHQPMSNEDGTIWITFNGEVYNHLELRADLEKKGHRYRGNSDTETIIHLYEEYGRNCVQHLRGMFAFAIWDEHQRSLLLARDRFGQKPLLYAETADGLTFASEFRALLQDPTVSRELDYTAIHHYLTYGYVPVPHSVFTDILKLPPANTLLWQNGQISIEQYWQLRYTPKLSLTETEAEAQLLALLREAIQLRLMSDVPLGAFLSGGVDSSAVVALMAEMMDEPVKTFSIGFNDQSFNELDYARQVAQQYATDHHEFVVTPDALEILPELVWAYGEPYADSSALPTYYVARETRQYVTVALNGDGGDEALAGYDRYRATKVAAAYERLPRWLREGMVAPFVSRLPESTRKRDLLGRIKRFVQAIDTTPERRYARWVTLMSPSEKLALYTPEFLEQMSGYDSLAFIEQAYSLSDSSDFIERTQAADVYSYLPNDLLIKVDIATMLHSLEARSPFLDHKLAEFIARLPPDYRLRGRVSKYILKRALRHHLTDDILYRSKQGFGVPVGRWFRHELKPVAYETLLDTQTLGRDIFRKTAVRTILDDHVAGRANHGQRIWALLMLELWFRTFVDRSREELTAAGEGIL